jgi:hypothetical protein
MRGKIIFIVLLLAILAYIVWKMMEFETSIRQERKITLLVEDETKPLVWKLADERLNEAASSSDYYFIAGRDYFRKLTIKYQANEKETNWEDFFLKGVNLGVAVPGKFPAEFSLTFDEYLEWLILIGEMNANIIRTYTILPPEFYEAFSYYNLHHNNKPVYLMQGVWAEVPADEDYYNVDFTREFQKEIIDAIDVIHGNAVLKENPGKAAGVYSTDISKYVAGLLLGREWEPASVFKTNQINNINQYNGDFICMNQGNAMEAWLANMMDFAVLYETQEYWSQHPVSFVNWLPLDPMYHNTEIIENSRVREYDNDQESIDFTKFHSSELFVPGVFAAYHVYPYYPDFIYLQDSYNNHSDKNSTQSCYLNYLEDLKLHTAGMPLVIAEYGLPSSRGNSHFMPDGFHQGGHSEADQAELSLTLTQNIVNSGCAGAIYFEWIDEWFKHNWLVMDFEQPSDDRKIWHNMENPEQNFGIYALENKIKTIDGEMKDWNDVRFDNDEVTLVTDSDASYFYIAAKIPGFDLSNKNLYFAIDTYDQDKGDHKLPFIEKVFENGFEFLLEFNSKDSAFILVDEPYSVFTDIYNDHIPVYSSKRNENGKFIHQLLLTNRGRVSLLGQKSDSVLFDRSPLLFGNSSEPECSNADWYFNQPEEIFEIRLDWHLLNVSDPAKRFVLDDIAGTGDVEYSKTGAFNIFLFVTDKKNTPILQFPGDAPFSCTWNEWEIPVYTERLKPLYFTLQDYFKNLSVQNQEETNRSVLNESFKIADYYNNRKGAVSISFDNAGFSQYQYALPVLTKYEIPASFGVIPGLLDDASRIYELGDDALLKRLSTKEVREMAVKNEIAMQIENPASYQSDQLSLTQKSHALITTLHCTRPSFNVSNASDILFIRKPTVKGSLQTDYKGINYLVINSKISPAELNDILLAREFQWTIIVYHHLYENLSEIPAQLSKEEASKIFIQKADFEKQVRLLRNTGYWIATEANVYKYKREKLASTIQTDRFQNIIFLKIINSLDMNFYRQPLTLEYKTEAQIIRISGSESDGTYSNKNGSFIFNALPNKEITIEIVE